ncbi:replication initiation factor domain-containing protein [Streptococcus mutans]|uniref:replication initiation factor domain-containing protein n=1 Tax=Streptococcus mutans TaxID=1309 RepID=UPI001454E7A6|nr:replication initiation factor domain-containing protein [Streptococcus mutans]NLQ47917.1 replication initiation factor domain-containing protein [Streptococcus mutans]
MNNSVRIDYFAVTVKKIPPEELLEKVLLIPKEKFTLNLWGINKYQRHYACSDIKIYFNQTIDNMGIYLELKGQGCRQYEEFMTGNENNWVALVIRLYRYHVNFTRIDIANDIYDKALSVPVLYAYCKRGLCITRTQYMDYHERSILETGERVGETVTIGARGNQQWCVYNKLMEQRGKAKAVDTSFWVRAELRCWQDKANIIAEQIALRRPLTAIYFEAINGHYRFVRPNDKDTNKRRREPVKWWQDYLGTEVKTTLSITRTKPTLKQSETWTEKSVSKTLAKLYVAKYEAYDYNKAESFIQDLLKLGLTKLTTNDEKDIEQYIREQQSSDSWGMKKDDL